MHKSSLLCKNANIAESRWLNFQFIITMMERHIQYTLIGIGMNTLQLKTW